MGVVLPFPAKGTGGQIGFTRLELYRLVDLYGRMVAAGLWKDYAIAFEPGGRHLMLYDLDPHLRPGDRIVITVNFERGPPDRLAALVTAAGGDVR